jgi:N-methylhydantoinase A
MNRKKIYIGVDIGGTFTDLVLAESDSGRIINIKTLTTPANPVAGVMKAVREGLAEVGGRPDEVLRVVHATTLPTNLVLERNGARVAFVTTAGFGDMFHIGKRVPQQRDRFNLFWRRTDPLIERDLIVEVDERLDYQGDVLRPLDVAGAEAKLAALAARKPEAVAICLIHAYADDRHEQAVAELARKHLPGAYVCLSSHVLREYQEYERASTTVLSAYIGPMLASYVSQLERELRELGVTADLQIMQSSGAVMSAAEAALKAAYAIESGPAAGVIATAHLGRLTQQPNLISFDMGGTTAKAGLVRQGEPQITNEFRVGGAVSSGSRDSGEPVRVPTIDLAEVGAGGGSVAWVDAGGFLQVGPQSAGSDPGPACYGLGGEAATVTDANVLLGYINPDYFVGGKMQIFPERSRAAIAAVAEQLGVDVLAAAQGIHDLANVRMGSAIRIVTLQRGVDPREQAIVAFGGAGPIHVARLAEQFQIPTIIVPPAPGVKSAFGLLVSDLAYDYVATMLLALDGADIAAINEAFDRMEAEGRAHLEQEARRGATIRIQRRADIRLAHQHQTQSIVLADGPITPAALVEAEAAFREIYRRNFGLTPMGPCELVNCRVRAVAVTAKPDVPAVAIADKDPGRGLKTPRQAYFAEAGGFVETRVYQRPDLRPGDVIAGPAIFEEPDSATVCPPGFRVEVDRFLNLVITKVENSPR